MCSQRTSSSVGKLSSFVSITVLSGVVSVGSLSLDCAHVVTAMTGM